MLVCSILFLFLLVCLEVLEEEFVCIFVVFVG